MPICSIACDKVDDLCAGYSDESDCGKAISAKLLFSLVAVGATLAVCMTVAMNLKEGNTRDGQDTRMALVPLNGLGDTEQYNNIRGLSNFGDIIANIVVYYHHKKDIQMQKKMAEKLFELEENFLKEGVDLDLALFNMLDTCETTMRLYDLKEESVGVKINSWIYGSVKFNLNKINKEGVTFCSCVIKLLIHYRDLVADLLLMHLIFRKEISNINGLHLTGRWALPSIMFVVTLASVVGAEIANLISLITNPSFTKWDWKRKLLSALVIPLMPAVLILQEVGHSLRIKTLSEQLQEQISGDSLHFECHLKALLANENEWMDSQRALLGEFKANVATIENFMQSTVVFLMILISNTTSPMMEGFEKIFLTEDPVLLYVFAMLSFGGLVWSPISHISSIKRGALGIIGKCLLVVYNGIGAATRVFMVVLLLTPALGLKGTQNVFARGSMEMQSLAGRISNFKWNYKGYRLTSEIDDFLILPLESGMWILLVVVVSHLTASFVFLHKDGGCIRRYMRGIHTIVAVPLFCCDWEEIYRSHRNAKGNKREEAESRPQSSGQSSEQEVDTSNSSSRSSKSHSVKANGEGLVDDDSAAEEKGGSTGLPVAGSSENKPRVQGVEVTFPLGLETNREMEEDIQVMKSWSLTSQTCS